jgi:lipopolysaccharide/colanic/teichoic acid biosynthesis glycosyltransferase
VGRFLRRYSLDELPQLFNVLKGEMSLVGPRPPLPTEVALYEDWQLDRLEVRPGITGLWQVSGRSELSFEEYVRLDLFYIENWSMLYDLFVMAKTIPILLLPRGAY